MFSTVITAIMTMRTAPKNNPMRGARWKPFSMASMSSWVMSCCHIVKKDTMAFSAEPFPPHSSELIS